MRNFVSVCFLAALVLSAQAQVLINSYSLGSGSIAPSTLDDGLVLYYKLDETSGTRTNAAPTGSIYNLGDTNTVLSTTGKISNAADFEQDTSEHLGVVDQPGLSFAGSFTAVCWVQFEDISADRAILAKWTSAGDQREYLLYFSATRLRLLVSADGIAFSSAVANTFGALSTGVTYFVACGYNADTDLAWISVNDGGVDSVSHTTGLFAGTSSFYLGTFGGIFGFMDGWIDEVGLWDRSLTTAEISELYAAGAGKTCCPFGSTPLASVRITEEGDRRVTEEGDVRTTEL